MPKLLTAAAIEKLKPSPHKRREVRDGGASGLYLCIQPSGHKSWVLRGRRPDGRQGKVTLGTVDLSRRDKGEPVLGAPLTLTAARVLANQLLRAKAQGIDVAEQKIQLSKKRLGGDTFADVAIGFIEDHCRPKNRGWRATARVLGLDYPKDGGEPELLRNGSSSSMGCQVDHASRCRRDPRRDRRVAAQGHPWLDAEGRCRSERVDADGRWPQPSASCSVGQLSTV